MKLSRTIEEMKCQQQREWKWKIRVDREFRKRAWYARIPAAGHAGVFSHLFGMRRNLEVLVANYLRLLASRCTSWWRHNAALNIHS